MKPWSPAVARRNFLRAALVAPVLACSVPASAHDLQDPKYGAVLFEYYQQNYFDALVEFAYAEERGGIQGHGHYPELLKGGVSLSYGLDTQAEAIFSRLIAEHPSEEVQNRAWFYLAKMQYLRGDTDRAADNLRHISGLMTDGLDNEYRYLATLVNVRLGHFESAEKISQGFDRSSSLAPYLFFNLGVAQGRQGLTDKALDSLQQVTRYADKGIAEHRLADRALMAMSFLHAQGGNMQSADKAMARVQIDGAYSNRALLTSSWSSVNTGQYQRALAPLDLLLQRSLALPEVQEALLLKPHVYEKLGLMGRAADGFIRAGQRYDSAIDQVRQARKSLRKENVLELFVSDLDQVLGESDWFGAAPSVSINTLSPFMLQLMADHAFQSLLKDLRDLYAVRNNLLAWQARRHEFKVILDARRDAMQHGSKGSTLNSLKSRQQKAGQDLVTLKAETDALPERKREKLGWMVEDLAERLTRSQSVVDQIDGRNGPNNATRSHAQQVADLSGRLEAESRKAEALIAKLETVMRELIAAELLLHEERLNYYRVQARLAKVRILDKSLKDLDGGALTATPQPDAQPHKGSDNKPAPAPDKREGDHAA